MSSQCFTRGLLDIRRYAIYLPILLWASGFSYAEDVQGSDDPRLVLDSYLEGLARGQIEVHQTPGIAVSLVSLADGTTNRAYGYTDLVQPQVLSADSSVFPIASISKVFVAIALLRARDMGILNLENEANAHLDFELPTFESSRAIRLVDIARHEAGFEERWLATGAGLSPDPRPWGEILAATHPELIAPPGAYASYSNYGIALLGYIIERASGQPYQVFLREQVIEPLGMYSTYIQDVDDPDGLNVAKGGVVSSGVAGSGEKTFNHRTYPAGRVLSSLPDMSRLMYMLMNDGVGENGVRILSSNAMNSLYDIKSAHAAMPGIGIVVAEKDVGKKRFVGHGGDGGTHHTDMILSLEDGVGVFVVFLSAPGPQARDFFTRALVSHLFPDSRFEPLPLPDQSAAKNLSEYTGDFRIYRWAFTSIERLLQLVSEFSVLDSGRGTLIVRGALSGGEYVPTQDTNVWQNRLTGELIGYSTGWNGDLMLNLGTFPFVTAYRLGWLDKQATNRSAFTLFTAGMGGLGVLLLGLAIAAFRGDARMPFASHLLLGLCALVCAGFTYFGVAFASSLSEPELQKEIPAVANWLLALPIFALAIALSYMVTVITGKSRPSGMVSPLVHMVTMALFVSFLIYLNHWHALGWHYP